MVHHFGAYLVSKAGKTPSCAYCTVDKSGKVVLPLYNLKRSHGREWCAIYIPGKYLVNLIKLKICTMLNIEKVGYVQNWNCSEGQTSTR